MIICPACESKLEITDDKIECSECSNKYESDAGIPLLFWPNEWGESKRDVTNIVKSFYERTPFPDYENTESLSGIIQKAKKSVFANLLNEQIPLNVKVLEIGCGTGQLSNFLGIAQRFIYGTDICINSLKKAQNFKKINRLDGVKFYQMNLFKPIFAKESFDFVICNGVLHHTSDPFLGFQTIAKLVKRNGYILVGLYNKYGRMVTDAHRSLFKLLGKRFIFLDPRLRTNHLGDGKKNVWFRDQYQNPHESKHTIGETLKWFDLTDFDFINSVPKLKAFKEFSESEILFQPNSRGNRLDHFLVQANSIFDNNIDNGLFLFIGKKRS